MTASSCMCGHALPAPLACVASCVVPSTTAGWLSHGGGGEGNKNCGLANSKAVCCACSCQAVLATYRRILAYFAKDDKTGGVGGCERRQGQRGAALPTYTANVRRRRRCCGTICQQVTVDGLEVETQTALGSGALVCVRLPRQRIGQISTYVHMRSPSRMAGMARESIRVEW